MSRHWRLMICWTALFSGTAAGQSVVTSAAPDRVAVTVYRDPNRDAATAPNLSWLNGYALITETRQVSIPADESTIRFEGVAGGILPQSAIVAGFPEGIVERNRDAYLLSPSTLVDRSLGQRVHLRRTSMATGAVREQEAVIRSGADGAVVLQTAEGFEALRCTGLADTFVFAGVPEGLTARPTLSVRTRASQPVTATVTLSYLASGFDWQANYIAYLSPDERRLQLFAWLTLASQDETSFPNADTQAVAGNLNREDVRAQPREGGPLNLQCWPQGTTSDIPMDQYGNFDLRGGIGEQGIVVTGTRVGGLMRREAAATAPVADMIATQEDLGDLKLYRIPEPVTIAANSQKQVALLTRPEVRVNLLYRATLAPGEVEEEPQSTLRVLATRNRASEGLGLPLPAGGLALFAEAGGRSILIGEGFVPDRAIDNEVEVELGAAPSVTTRTVLLRQTPRWSDYELIVTSDRPHPVRFEAQFEVGEASSFRPARRLGRRNGRPLWAIEVPANGATSLRYRIQANVD